jgi:hypothetical protein
MFDIVCPVNAPQIYVPPLSSPSSFVPQGEELSALVQADPHIFRLLKQEGVMHEMTLVTKVSKELRPGSRRQRLAIKFCVLKRLTTHMRRGTLRLFRRHLVCLPGWKPHEGMTARVATLVGKYGESARKARKRQKQRCSSIPTVKCEVTTFTPIEKPKAPRVVSKPAKIPVSEAEASAAAITLARLPRQRKIWSGWIGPTRSYCGMPIKLPNGEQVYVFGTLRGRVVWSRVPGDLVNLLNGVGVDWGVLPAGRVKVVKNQQAALLGRLKAGKVERPSRRKQEAARANGCRPPRPGSRPRGRPPGRGKTLVCGPRGSA